MKFIKKLSFHSKGKRSTNHGIQRKGHHCDFPEDLNLWFNAEGFTRDCQNERSVPACVRASRYVPGSQDSGQNVPQNIPVVALQKKAPLDCMEPDWDDPMITKPALDQQRTHTQSLDFTAEFEDLCKDINFDADIIGSLEHRNEDMESPIIQKHILKTKLKDDNQANLRFDVTGHQSHITTEPTIVKSTKKVRFNIEEPSQPEDRVKCTEELRQKNNATVEQLERDAKNFQSWFVSNLNEADDDSDTPFPLTQNYN